MMEEAPTIRFAAGEQWQVRLSFESRAFPTANLAWDRDAIITNLDVRAGAFQCQFITLIFSHELLFLQHLLTELDQQVGHEVQRQFESREGVLSLIFELTKLGHIKIKIKISDMELPPAMLSFTIQSDQTSLAQWIHEVTEVLKQFPPQIT
jgi:hypothetical protein